jgi:tRNA U38,U39,U40 pseudouridine synthase TruA
MAESSSPEHRWRVHKVGLEASYHGVAFGGWQRQDAAAEAKLGTVQGRIEQAARNVVPTVWQQWVVENHHCEINTNHLTHPQPELDGFVPWDMHAAAHGRTDRGVHARQHPFFLRWKSMAVVDAAAGAEHSSCNTGMNSSAGESTTHQSAVIVPTALAERIATALNLEISKLAAAAAAAAPPPPDGGRASAGAGHDLGSPVLLVRTRKASEMGKITGKTYSYFIHAAPRPRADLAPFCWFVPASWRVQVELMQAAASVLEGTHYFGRFAAGVSGAGAGGAGAGAGGAGVDPGAGVGADVAASLGDPPSLVRTLQRVVVTTVSAADVAAADFAVGWLQSDAPNDDGMRALGVRVNVGAGAGARAAAGKVVTKTDTDEKTAAAVVIVIHFTGDGFLKRMARMLTRAVVAVGEEALSIPALQTLLMPPETTGAIAAVPVTPSFSPAPAHGLWLQRTFFALPSDGE